jgi:ArsR family transcriptional regulator, lead/cadmium/zinc/bismuth-responsive transcriptional repressor
MSTQADNPIELADEKVITRLAEIFAAMGDPNRLRIISVLSHHELNVGDLARVIGLSESATSHQLRLLRTLRLVRSRKEGQQVFYALADDHVHDLLDRGLEHILHE